MPPSKRKMHAYTEEAMQNALAEVQRGMRVATAAKLYEVPRVTLLYKVKGTTPPYRRMGPESILSPHEEHILVEWIISVRKAGFYIGMNELFNSVQYHVIKNKRLNPFKNNRPGRTWFVGFKRRNPRVIPHMIKPKVSVTKENILRWFDGMIRYLKDKKENINIFDDPRRIFNADEVALFLNPEKNKGFVGKNEKNYQLNLSETDYLTVFITGNAQGELTPPLIVFKDNFPENITNNLPEKWGIGKTETGWVNSEIFFNFISKVFQPFLIQKQIQLPVILFLDAQKYYVTLHTSQFCDENGIILIAFYPKTSNFMGPMELSVFQTLKLIWSQNLVNTVTKLEFPFVLKGNLEEIEPKILQEGFKKSGLVPFSPKSLQTEFAFSENTKQNEATSTKENIYELKAGLEFLEKYVDNEKIEQFKTSNVWKGDLCDLGLFNLWKKISKALNQGYYEFNNDDSMASLHSFESVIEIDDTP
ncbi:uncharacterized protein [Onthophagus taurus]|uniref:uncharacterized protein n=1 Tax=Onthophagus taurus TaxID=166361 RepID=UPI0039BEBC0B